jgi:hypothetical protein
MTECLSVSDKDIKANGHGLLQATILVFATDNLIEDS